ncbi:20367_t:CDS:2, partial [Dentiscutata erythropus]
VIQEGAAGVVLIVTIITYLEKNPTASKHNTAEIFNITTKQLRDWIKKKKELKIAPPFVRRLNTSSHPKYPLLENELKTWIRSLCSSQKVVTQNMVKTKAKQLAKASRFTSIYPKINECKWNNASDSESIIDLTLNNNNENDGGSDSLGEENRNDDNNENGSNKGDDYSNDNDNSEDRDGSGEENRNDDSDNKNSSNEGGDLNDQEDHEEDTYYEDKVI